MSSNNNDIDISKIYHDKLYFQLREKLNCVLDESNRTINCNIIRSHNIELTHVALLQSDLNSIVNTWCDEDIKYLTELNIGKIISKFNVTFVGGLTVQVKITISSKEFDLLFNMKPFKHLDLHLNNIIVRDVTKEVKY